MSGIYPSHTPVAATATPEGAPVLRDRISWGAIVAGALIAIAIGTALNVLGFAIGVTAVDAAARDTPSAGTFGIVGGIWLVVSNLLGLAIGGYVAARLSGTADSQDATLHGGAVWAAAYLVSAIALGSAVSGAAHTATSAVSNAMGGAMQGIGRAASAAVPETAPEELVQRARLALSGPSEPARMTSEQRGAEMSELIGKRVASGGLSAPDRTRLNQLVAAEAGISEADAANRVQAYEAEAQRVAAETEQKAREAADAAAKAAAVTAFWIFGALLLGAGAAIIGARTGTRDLTTLAERRRLA